MREHPGWFVGGLRGGPPPLLRCEIFLNVASSPPEMYLGGGFFLLLWSL